MTNWSVFFDAIKKINDVSLINMNDFYNEMINVRLAKPTLYTINNISLLFLLDYRILFYVLLLNEQSPTNSVRCNRIAPIIMTIGNYLSVYFDISIY